MNTSDPRPWAASYPPDVPIEIDVPDETLVDLLDTAVTRFGPAPALDFFGATTSYRELGDRVARAAEGLRRLGVGPGDRVAIMLPNCPHHVVAFYAALRLGATVVEHNPLYTAEELAFQLGDHRPKVVIAWDKIAPTAADLGRDLGVSAVLACDLTTSLPRLKRLALRLPVAKARETREAMTAPAPGIPGFDRLMTRTPPLATTVPPPTPDDTALLQYTGGTTGRPKAAVLTHRNLRTNTEQGKAWLPVREGEEVVYAVLPFFHVYGLTLCLTYAISVGAVLVLFPRFDVDMVLEAQRRRPATFLPAVPPIYEKLATAAPERGADLSSIRHAFSGAMPLLESTADRWREVTGGTLVEGFGMTETSPVALANPPAAPRIGTVGVPFPSTEIRVVDQDDPTKDVPLGQRGELLIRGPQVFHGYWNRPEETAKVVLDDGWIRTGDIVVMDEDGYVRVVDRIKELIITGGFNVYPSDVEAVLRDIPGIAEAAVVGLPSSAGDEEVHAAVTLEPGATFDEKAVRDACRERLAAYKVPRSVVTVEELPRTIIGKVLHREVKAELERLPVS